MYCNKVFGREKYILTKIDIKRFIIFAFLFLLIGKGQAAAEPWNFAMFSDTRDSSSDPAGDGVNEDAITAIATDIADNRSCSFVLVPGDLVRGEYGTNPATLDSQYQSFKDAAEAGGLKVAGSSGEEIPYYPVRGNHEIYNTTHGTNIVTSWQDAFDTVPQNGSTTATSGDTSNNSEVGLTYSFTYNNSLFLGVDEYANDKKINQDWVNQTLLDNSDSQHIFAFGHEPVYEALHDDCVADQHDERDAFLTSLYNAGGRLYFCGHDHFLALGRVYEKDPDEGGTQGFYQMINGAGGATPGERDFDGEYNTAHSLDSDYSVADLYHDSDSGAGIPYHYGYVVVTLDDDLEWLKIYGTVDLGATINWQLLHALIISGTLQTDASILTSSATNDAAIVFNQSSDGTYSGIMQGTGTLTKSGSATLTLSGTNTYTGATTINAGTLNVTGSCSSSAVTVNSSGILMGTGPINGLTNFGIVKPGSSVGTLDLGGDAFTQGASGTLEIEVESTAPGDYDQIINASEASLDGTLTTITSGTYALEDTLSGVIETTGGINGSFSCLYTQITPTIVWKPEIDGDDLDLVARRDYNNDRLKTFLTPNAKNIATIMAAVLPTATGDLATVKTEIDNLTTNAGVSRAYSEVSPQKLNSLPSFAFSNVGQHMSNLQNQLYALRTGLNTNTGYANRDGAFSEDLHHSVLLVYKGDDWEKFMPKENSSAVEQGGWRLAINGSGSYAEGDSTDNQTGFDCTTGEITAGLSYGLKDNVVVGVHSGYALSNSDLKGSGGDVDVDTVSYGIYASGWGDNSYLNVSIGSSSNFYDTERNIVFGGLNRTAEADTFGQQLNSFVGGGYDFDFKKLDIGPTMTLQYSKIWIDSFSERDAGALNMHLADQQAESLQLGLGVRATYDLEYKGKRVVPEAYVSYQHEFCNDRRTIDARLKQGSDVFQVQTDDPDRDFALLGCRLTMKFAETISFNLGYQALVGQHDYFSHRVNGSIAFYF